MPVDLSTLNPEQRRAAEVVHGPALVIAGAGSGKTRVLTHRIANLIETGAARPHEILSITFTNRAAEEMRERVETLLHDRSLDGMWVCTFHSACGRILRREIEKIGWKSNFTIYDADDALRMVKRCAKELEVDLEKLPAKKIAEFISDAKNKLVTATKLKEFPPEDGAGKVCAKVYRLYQQRLKEGNAIDFDDMVMLTALLLHADQETREHWQQRFKFILVDEYQDTNYAQAKLLELLGGHRNVFVVGDPDQSCYAFRGADIRNIMQFEKAFPGCVEITLDQNYRSTNKILRAANTVIDHNPNRKPKRLWSENGEGDDIVVRAFEDERDEATAVIDEIRYLEREEGISPNEIAILYRTNAQSRAFEEEFLSRGISYRMVGGTRFYERQEVKDALALLSALQNPADVVALGRVMQRPKRGLGDTSIQKLTRWARANDKTLAAALGKAEEAGLTGKAKVGAAEIREIFRALAQQRDKVPLGDLMEQALELSGYRQMLEREGTHEARGRLENLDELVAVAKRHDEQGRNLTEFLQEVALYSESDKMSDGEDRVTLMTMHNAKGLEFEVVYLVGLEEGLFPHSMSLNEGTMEAVEEERRLFYVGVTRAKRRLTISHVSRRFLFGESKTMKPSRFLAETGLAGAQAATRADRLAPRGQYEKRRTRGPGEGSSGGGRPGGSRSSGKPAWSASQSPAVQRVNKKRVPVEGLARGAKVRHPKFGAGVVQELSSDGKTITVVFLQGGARKLALEYAPLELIL